MLNLLELLATFPKCLRQNTLNCFKCTQLENEFYYFQSMSNHSKNEKRKMGEKEKPMIYSVVLIFRFFFSLFPSFSLHFISSNYREIYYIWFYWESNNTNSHAQGSLQLLFTESFVKTRNSSLSTYYFQYEKCKTYILEHSLYAVIGLIYISTILHKSYLQHHIAFVAYV